jgi:uncharacterized protein YutE (UPF0331/DUF86 family)
MTPGRYFRWPFLLVSGASIVLIGARMIWPDLSFDTTSLILFGISIVAFLLPFIPLKKVKWGDFEAELDREIDTFERKVEATEAATDGSPIRRQIEAAAAHGTRPTWEGFYEQYAKLVSVPSSNTEKILSAALLLEKMISTAAEVLDPDERAKLRTPRALVDRFGKEGLISEDERSAFLEFWTLRNRVVHEGARLSNEQTVRILDLVGRLVRTLA